MANYFGSYRLAAVISLVIAAAASAGELLGGDRPPSSGVSFLDDSFSIDVTQSPIEFQLGVDHWTDARLEHRPTITASNAVIRRLPPVVDELSRELPFPVANPSPGERIDGTWREDKGHITININGRELKLAKADARSAGLSQPNTASGEVLGRLSHGGRPLVDCLVALIPLTKIGNRYDVNGSAEPRRAKTDDRGVYHFVDVPPGPYKLSWLPAGQRQWIRRIEFRPDVRVRENDVAKVKEIRVSLRTIN